MLYKKKERQCSIHGHPHNRRSQKKKSKYPPEKEIKAEQHKLESDIWN